MSNSVIGALRVVLGADTAAFEKGLTGAQKTLNKFNRDMQKLSAKFVGMGQTLTLGLTVPIVAFGVASVKAAQESADAFAQVQASLKSMGNASGRTMEQLQANAKALQNMAAIDDDEILRKITANLLTFDQVSGPVFDRAQAAILDMSVKLGKDLQESTIMVGKALQNPVKGITALTRAGVSLSPALQATIKSLVATGQSAKAQEIILKELERQFGGSAKAAADANPYQRLNITLGDLKETIGAKLIPVIQPLVDGLNKLLMRFDGLSPAAQKFVVVGGIIAAAIGPVLMLIGGLISAVGSIAAVFAGPAFAALVAFVIPFAPIIAAVGALVGVFLLFRKQIVPVLHMWADVVANALGPKILPLIEALKSAFIGFAELVAPLFAPSGLIGKGLFLFLSYLTRVVGGAVSILGGLLDFVTGIFNAIGAGLRGDWSAMWGHLGKAVWGLVKGIAGAFGKMFPEVVSWVRKTWEGVRLWLVDKFASIVKAVGEKVQAVAGFFKKLWDAVVGHSYVPDMVGGIRDEFARLDQVMVRPAEQATARVEAAYARMADAIEGANDNLGDPRLKLFQTAPTGLGEAAATGAQTIGSIQLPAFEPMAKFGGKIMPAETVDALKEQMTSAFRGALDALRSGGTKGLFEWMADSFTNRLMDRLAENLTDLFDQVFAQMRTGSGGGGILGKIAQGIGSLFGGGGSSKLPGFATGGGFKVGGWGGVDSQVMSFRATPGEMVDIRHGNDNGAKGSVNHFHLAGAVVTQDLLDQMNAISAQGDMQVYARVNGDRARDAQAARYRVARGGR